MYTGVDNQRRPDFGRSNGGTFMNTLHSPTGEEKHPRKKPWRWILILVPILVILGIGIGIVVLLTQPGQLTLTEADSGKTVQAHPGDRILIQLSANVTTGFSWAIDKTDTTILALQHESYTPYPGGAIGSGGTTVFTFIAQHAGTAHLQLKYWRSWEGDSSIVKHYDITVQVQGE